MYRTTITASPLPNSKVCDTFRPRIGQSATIRADLGGETLVHFVEPSAMLNSLVRQLSAKGRPAGIENRLCHAGFGKRCGINVANNDIVELAHECGRALVQEVLPTIEDLGMYRFNSSRFARALCDRQRRFGFPVKARRNDLVAVRQGDEIFQSQISTNSSCWHPGGRLGYLKHDIQEPIAPAVAGEIAAIRNFPFGQWTRVKHSVSATRKAKRMTFSFQLASFERHPTQRFPPAIAQIRSARPTARLRVLLANVVNRARMQPQFLAATGSESDEIETCMPAAMETQCILLPVITIVPNKVNRPCLPIQQAGQRFHAVSKNQSHLHLTSRAKMSSFLIEVKSDE